MYDIEKYKSYVDRQQGEKNRLTKQHNDIATLITQKKRELKNIEEAQLIIQHVGQQTQQELEYQISDIVSTALSAVFDSPYEFKIEFVQKRGQTEAELYFMRGSDKIDPTTESGGGAVDVAAFAIRLALWSISRAESCNTIILDEPFRFLSRELQPRAGEMLKRLSNKLDVQFIIVTHNQDLIEAADRVFSVRIKNGRTTVE